MNQINENYEGFAQSNAETLEVLSKALTAGSGVDASAFTGGRALTPESLDFTLVNVLASQDEARLFKALKKTPIKSVVHQWNKRTEVGADFGAWVGEGADSIEGDQTIARATMTAKYLQCLRKVTLQAAYSNMVEDATALEKQAGTLWIIRNMEKALFNGDSSMVAEEPDGLVKQIPTTNVIDVRGAKGSTSTFEGKITEGCRVIRDNFGRASLFLASTKVTQDIQALLRDRIRWPNVSAEGVVGSTYPTSYPTPFGSPDLKDDIYIQEGSTPVVSTSASAPDAPTLSSGAHTSDADSQFASGDAGDYYYVVQAVNKYGPSAASTGLQVTGVASGDKVTFTIAKGSTVPTAYFIFRSQKGATDATDCRYLTKVAYTGTTQTFTDLNADLPGTSSAYLLTMDSVYDAIEFFQFLPLMKFDLYPTNAAVLPFLMLLYGGLAVKKPTQHVRIKNIGVTGGWYT